MTNYYKKTAALRQIKARPSADDVMQATKNLLPRDEKLARQLGIYLSHKHRGLTLKQLHEMFNMRETAICEASRRIKIKIEQDTKLRKQIVTTKEALRI